MNNERFKFILTRHSEAIHNELKGQIRSYIGNELKYKKSPEYLDFKFNAKYADRQQINQQEVQKCLNNFDKDQVGLVIVSPLARCICTALELNLSSEVQIVVQPLITSRITSAWSIGESLAQKKQKFPRINLDYCQKQQINWCIDILLNDQSDFKQYYAQNKQKFPDKQTLLLEYAKRKKGQTYKSIIKRAIIFKEKLEKTYVPLTDKKILVISHSNFLKVLTSNRINSKGKAMSDMIFDHMDLVYCSSEFLLDSYLFQKHQY